MIEIEKFISKEKAIVIAPAGYGKTHLIVDCLKESENRQLILTHTHAGVAAIKARIKKAKISSRKYQVETITSFSQKYVFAFYSGTDIPKQEDSKNYYPFLINKCTELFKIDLISSVFKRSYSGLFVDEYQDCTSNQHLLIKTISNQLPTRILGDPLQGIFNFSGSDIVNLEDDLEFKEFNENKYNLTTPWRWKNINEGLGQELDQMRKNLIDGNPIDISQLKQVITKKYDPSNLFDAAYGFSSFIYSFMSEKSLLVIHPDSSNLNVRISFNKTFKNKFNLLESIDGKDFYKEAIKLDNITKENSFIVLKTLSDKLFNKTTLNYWFNNTGVKNKRKEEDKVYSDVLKEIVDDLNSEISLTKIKSFFEALKKLPEISTKRRDLLNSIIKAIEEASLNDKTIYESMLSHRNKIRIVGRKVMGKCIGTTLLTKGLEFDTVVILKANDFTCKKNFYVAISRACKKLVLCYNHNIIQYN